MHSHSKEPYEASTKPVASKASGFLPARTIHIHPTRRCNLECSHCYSSSSPDQNISIAPSIWRQVLPRLRREGYAQVSLSGGEPLLYGGIEELVSSAADAGHRITLISNGILLRKPTARLRELLKNLDGIAISFDGLQDRHDAIRRKAGAFQQASEAVATLSDEGLSVAAAISVNQESIEELPDLVDHLVSLGVRAVQIRPIAAAGRAVQMVDSLMASDHDRLRLYLVVRALAIELGQQIRIHGDLVPARALWNQRDAYSDLLNCSPEIDGRLPRLSDLVNPLVITDTAIMKPLAFDMHPAYDLGRLECISDSSFTAAYQSHGRKALSDLIGESLQSMATADGVVDWFDHLARMSYQTAST